jgi:hypothetical protein
VSADDVRASGGGSGIRRHGHHGHAAPRTVLIAVGVTLVAAAADLSGS